MMNPLLKKNLRWDSLASKIRERVSRETQHLFLNQNSVSTTWSIKFYQSVKSWRSCLKIRGRVGNTDHRAESDLAIKTSHTMTRMSSISLYLRYWKATSCNLRVSYIAKRKLKENLLTKQNSCHLLWNSTTIMWAQAILFLSTLWSGT